MAIQEVRASRVEHLALSAVLLQRARLADTEAGLPEPADLQRWGRTPRRPAAIEDVFWIDEKGPVAAVLLTDWGRARAYDPSSSPALRLFRFQSFGSEHGE